MAPLSFAQICQAGKNELGSLSSGINAFMDTPSSSLSIPFPISPCAGLSMVNQKASPPSYRVIQESLEEAKKNGLCFGV